MAIFSKKIQEESKQMTLEEVNHFNKIYNLPFSNIGDIYQGVDFVSKQITADKYAIRATYGHGYGAGIAGIALPWPSQSYNSSGLMAQMFPQGKEHVVDPATMKAIIDGISLPHLGLPRMTKEEKEKLSTLKKELEVWKKQQKLNKFKELPTHIRQDVVDEAIAHDTVKKMDSIDESQFPDSQELKRLSSLESATNIYGGLYNGAATAGYAVNFEHGPLRYGHIISRFTTEELMKAHAEASLEDEISN